MENALVRIVYAGVRHCFYRGEKISLSFNLMNFVPHNLNDCRLRAQFGETELGIREIPLLSTFGQNTVFEFESMEINSGRYPLRVTLEQNGEILAEETFSIAVAPPRKSGGMALWHWPSTVHYNALEADDAFAVKQLQRLADMGFTWAQFRAGWALHHPERAIRLIEEAMMLGVELGILIENAGGGLFKFTPDDPPETRLIPSDGSTSELANAFHPAFERRVCGHAEHLMTLFREFPSCSTVFMNSEVEDKLRLPCDSLSLQRHEKALGFPLERVVRKDCIFNEKLPGPVSGVIPDNDPEYRYALYYFKEGDGFTHTNRMLSETFHCRRPDLFTITDPLRNASVYGRFDGMDAVSSWTYTNPDPKAMLFTETLQCAAAPGNQAVVPTITLWNYAGTLVPSGSNRFAREQTLRMEPDRYTECAWLNFSRGVRAIGHYFGSPIEMTFAGGSPFLFSPETEQAIRDFSSRVLRPFGALARKTVPCRRKIAVLDSFASRIYGVSPRPYNHYPVYSVYNFYTLLAMAHLEADILFDESVTDGVLERYEMLVLPCCDTLPESVYKKVKAFAEHGGRVVADSFLRADIHGVIRFHFDFEYRKRVNANANTKKSDFALKDDTNFRREWDEKQVEGVPADRDQEIMESYASGLRRVLDPLGSWRMADCSTPRALLHCREYGSSRYVFITNDNRTWGDRVGSWKSMLEKGLPLELELSLENDGLFTAAYELVSGKPLALRCENGRCKVNLTLPAASGAIVALYPSVLSPLKAGGKLCCNFSGQCAGPQCGFSGLWTGGKTAISAAMLWRKTDAVFCRLPKKEP